jgi:hypothetical protein
LLSRSRTSLLLGVDFGLMLGLFIAGCAPTCEGSLRARLLCEPLSAGSKGEFELGAWFEGACGSAWVLARSQMREHGPGPFGRAHLHPRRKLLDRQGRFAPQPGGDGQLGAGAV